MDPLGALASFVQSRIEAGVWAMWLKFLFTLLFSGLVAFLEGFSASVAALGASAIATAAAGKPGIGAAWALVISLGAGAGWGGICMVKKFRQESEKIAKGMSVVIPGFEAALEFAEQFQTQTITKSK